MIDFKFYNPCKIIFGQESHNQLEMLLSEEKATSILLIYSGEFIKTLGIYTHIKSTVDRIGARLTENGNVTPNPKIELVSDLVQQARANNVDFILAVGGGSAIDTAKAVAIGVGYDGDVWDFFSGSMDAKTAMKIGVIATLPASGSETSNCAILSKSTQKSGYESDLIIPRFAIMNPTYTLGLPSYQTACGIADILSHLLERYFSDVPHQDTTDFMIEGAIRSLLLNAQRVLSDNQNYDARAEIQWVACIAHNNILDTGRIADWGSHRIEHELSGEYGITHGEGMAVVLVAWTKYVAKIKPYMLAQLANRVYGIDGNDEEQMALALSNKLQEFFKELELKTTLTELQIDSQRFALMADKATKNNTQTVGHYLPINRDMFIEILKEAL